jgi:hypothetical protein
VTKYSSLYQLTAEGLKLYDRVMTRRSPEEALDVSNPLYATRVPGTVGFETTEFATAKEMAEAICASFGKNPPQEAAGNIGLWAWLTFVNIDTVFPVKKGIRQFRAYHRWYPSAPNDWQKAQRHLVRMPVLLFAAFGDDADHLICGKPSLGPEIREQLTSQQDMFTPNFQRACRILYYDEETGTVKKGAASKKGPGTTRRLAAVRLQLDVTWDMTDLPPERIIELLPAEFTQFASKEAA